MSKLRASIIILSRHQPEMLLACLESINNNVTADVEFEIILLLNDADPDVIEATKTVPARVRTIHSNVNLGFPGGCNRAAAFARGEYLVFLNDDTNVYPGWLESLVETADRYQEAGAVGSLVLNQDSTIQEAGAIVWPDGDTFPIDTGMTLENAEHYFLREADYCSACSLLIRRSAWEITGGMDEAYFPGYYEDVDLCFKIRQHGMLVLFDPGSAMMHLRSVSTDNDFKLFLVRKHKAFFCERWRDVLSKFEARDSDLETAIERAIHRARGHPSRVLITGSASIIDLSDIPTCPSTMAVSVMLPGLDGEDRIRLGRKGIHVITEQLADHLCRRATNYDYAIVLDGDRAHEQASIIRSMTPHIAMTEPSEVTSPAESGELAKLLKSLRAQVA